MSAWHITLKDLLLLSRDKRALVLLLVLPLMFISIVGMSTGQLLTRDENSERFKIVVVDLNNSETSRDLVTELAKKPELLIRSVPSKESADDLVRSGDASLILVVGPKFEELVEEIRVSDIFNSKDGPAAAGLAALDLEVVTKPNSAGIGRLLEGVVRSQVIGFIAPIAARKNPVTRAWVRSREIDEVGSSSASVVPTQDTPKSKQNAV